MIDQTFADVATPLIRARLEKVLGIEFPKVPVVVKEHLTWEDSWGYTPEDVAEYPAGPEGVAMGITNFDQDEVAAPNHVILYAKQLSPSYNMMAALMTGVGPFDEYAWAAAVLAHELIHTTLPAYYGHVGAFVDRARRAGLIGPPTSSFPGSDFAQWVEQVVVPAYKKVASPIAISRVMGV
jgi:hypothetical protein